MNTDFDAMNRLSTYLHAEARSRGWYDRPVNIGERLMLVVSEVAEAMEGDRKGLSDDHLPHRSSVAVELADAVIRICDLAGYLGVPLGDVMREKVEYNRTRLDHDPANRQQPGGKKY